MNNKFGFPYRTINPIGDFFVFYLDVMQIMRYNSNKALRLQQVPVYEGGHHGYTRRTDSNEVIVFC